MPGLFIPCPVFLVTHCRSDKFLDDVPQEHVRTFVSADPAEQVRAIASMQK